MEKERGRLGKLGGERKKSIGGGGEGRGE